MATSTHVFFYPLPRKADEGFTVSIDAEVTSSSVWNWSSIEAQVFKLLDETFQNTEGLVCIGNTRLVTLSHTLLNHFNVRSASRSGGCVVQVSLTRKIQAVPHIRPYVPPRFPISLEGMKGYLRRIF